jgi:hypothetical protein
MQNLDEAPAFRMRMFSKGAQATSQLASIGPTVRA